jgi:hypothetical protein
LQVTASEVIVDAAACTVTGTEPDFVESWVLVAVILTVPAAAGAVNSPAAVMVPPLADHVTAEL